MISAEKIIVALDTPDPVLLKSLLTALKDTGVWVKVGMELFYSLGPSVIHEAKTNGFKIFLDLKLHDIPTTVAKSLKALNKLPIDMINVHAAGGSEMMKAAVGALKNSPQAPLLIAVTQLTSTSNIQMNQEQRILGDLMESVVNFAKLAKESGCDGIVSSPHEVTPVKLICGSRFLTVTPGIRPRDNEKQDQKRTTTPLEAIHMGADFLVIGRPITQSADPLEALLKILKES